MSIQKLNIKVVSTESNESSLNSDVKAHLIIKYLDTRYCENELCYIFIPQKKGKFFLIFVISSWLTSWKNKFKYPTTHSKKDVTMAV